MSPRTSKQNEARREDTRRLLLDAAVGLFAHNGYDSTGTGDVARAAGVSHGALFNYFPTKDELFRAAVLSPLSPTDAFIEAITTTPGEPMERIEALVRAMLTSFAREESYLALVQYVVRLRGRFPELYAEIDKFVQSAQLHMAAVIKEGQDQQKCLPGDANRHAFFVYALIQGCGLMHRAPADDPVWDDAVSAALRLIAAPSMFSPNS